MSRFSVRPLALSGLIALASFAWAAQPAEAGWKWKKMEWVPKHGQEHRSPYARPGYGQGYGHGHGYGYSGSRSYPYQNYGGWHASPYGYGGGYGPRRDWGW